jgi:hypothetical protein
MFTKPLPSNGIGGDRHKDRNIISYASLNLLFIYLLKTKKENVANVK